jgi:plastocyanin
MKKANLFALFVAGFSLFCLSTARAADHTVNMYYYNPGAGFYYFSPTNVSVPKGDTVTWVNSDFYPYGGHTATSGTGSEPDGLWDTGLVANQGDHYTLSTASIAPGTYPYFCTVDEIYNMTGSLTVTAVVNNPPTANITSPTNGTRFLARANVTLMAAATDDGSVTNVQFFSGVTSLGNVAASPFNFTVNNLGAGNYSFTAKAFDNLGVTTISPAVTVFVETNATITSSVSMASGAFKMTLSGIAGQSYAIETSSNLLNWSPLFTNIAPTDVFSITDGTSTNVLQRFYRARQDF